MPPTILNYAIQAKKAVPQKVLSLTYKYQKRYPGTYADEPAPGRITLKKRPKYNRKVAKLLVRDKNLRKLLLANDISSKEQNKRIIEYALKKANGNKQQARRFLGAVKKQIEEGIKVDIALVKEKAKKQGLNEKETMGFVDHISHMYESTAQLLVSILSICIKEIQ